jgi:hypothetical protein
MAVAQKRRNNKQIRANCLPDPRRLAPPVSFVSKRSFVMPNDNLISATVSAEDVLAIKDAVAVIRGKLPFMLSLSPQERREMAKMGEKSIGFDEKCTLYMNNHADFVPGFVDMAEVARDRALRSQMLEVWSLLNALTLNVDDTLMVVNQDIWMANLAYYQSVREAAKRGRPNAQSIYDDLRTRFPGGGASKAAVAPASAG